MEKESQAERSSEKDTGRVEAFSDGVFSIAMTLLVLELKVPQFAEHPTAGQLLTALGRQWPSYFAFVTSFATVLIMWVNHHGIFKLVRRTSGSLMFANGLLLLLVTVVPFPTALVAAYLKTPAAATACAVYAGLFVVIATAYGLVLLAVRRDKKRMMPGAEAEVSRRIRDCFKIGIPLYTAAAVATLFSIWVSLGICTALWVFWVCGSFERRGAFT